MNKVKPHNPYKPLQKPINNYFVDKNWVTIDRNGISVHSLMANEFNSPKIKNP